MYKLTKEELTYIFTKPLPRDKFDKFVSRIEIKANDMNIKSRCWKLIFIDNKYYVGEYSSYH